ncbi:MAG: protein kinase [Deltaproteobacteria bacterium]|nr:protein kinase [Deltaproteobacteria bacterium]
MSGPGDSKPTELPTVQTMGVPTAPGKPSALPPAIPSIPSTADLATVAPPPSGDYGAPPTSPGMATIAPVSGAPAFPMGAPPEMPASRYELGSEIARGGMGRVVDATDTLLGRVVALKEALDLDGDALKRFARETRITARLEHPAIVPVHDAGAMPNGAPYYVMRKISGRPLERFVATAETLNDRLVLVPHIVTAAQAIAHAHARGIVHRDIKPSNILVGDLGETVVIDWGLAKVIGEADDPTATPHRLADLDDDSIKTRAGIVFGTPGFMAPEQLRGHAVDERCDVYALGATLYHLLSRRPPHHAKTADEMMKSAASAPPTPIGELVPGVPPELSTIIDKSLAHDPEERYQDARELAEDLQRFLAGQLVASHHYTARERMWRFVKRHRVPVAISLAAVAALSVVIAIAVHRVVGERDRADDAAQVARAEKQIAEEERARAEDRLDKLTLTQARSQVATNPTLAVAMLKPLAQRHWREVRSIASAARAAGVAWSLPASKKTATLELSRDGLRALAAGEDGTIRLHDLPARRTRVVAERDVAPGSFGARFGDAERRIVVWNARKLAVLDASSGAVASEIEAPTAIRDLEVAGRVAYWTDDKGAVWSYELGTAMPMELPLDERVDQLTPSPNGRWVALWGERHLLLLDRSATGVPQPAQVLLGVTRDLDWGDDSANLAALVDLNGDRNAIVVEVDDDGPYIRQKRFVGQRRFVAYSNRRAYTVGPLGIAVVPLDKTRAISGDPVGIREARGGTVVAGSTGTVVVMSAAGVSELKVPAGRIDIVEASSKSPFVLATIEHHLVLWNLDEVQPRILGRGLPQHADFVGNDRALASYVEDPAQLYDLDRGSARELPQLSLRKIAAAGDGRAACAIDAGGHAQLIAGAGDPVDLGAVDLAGFATPTALLLGSTAGGAVRLYDVARRSERVLVARGGAKLVELAWNRGTPTYVAATFDDGTLWRHDLGTGPGATVQLPVTPKQLLVAPDGTVLFPEGRTLRAWRSGGALEAFATLPRAILAVGLAGPARAFAFTERDGAFQIDLAAGDPAARAIETEPFEEKRAAMAIDAGTLVVAGPTGVDVVDPLVRYRWTLAPTSPEFAYGKPRISNDGRRVMAQTGDHLLVWTFVVPGDATATAAWLAAMTNAATAPATGVLTWQQ